MADTTALQNIDQQFPIVDTRTGRPTDYLMRYLFDRQGYLTEADQELATILARQIIAGDGLTGGGELGDGDVTLNADVQAILDLISTTQGSILYRGADDWAALAPGSSGRFLKTNGAGANPEWATPSGGGGSGGNGEAPWSQPSAADFTQRVGTGSISDFASGVNIQAPGTASNSNSLAYCVQSVPTPGANGWEAIGRFRRHFPLTSWMATGMILRDDVGGRSRLYWLGNDSVTGFNRNTYTNDTTWDSVTGLSSGWSDLDFWMRIVDDLTNHIIYVSKDGISWQQIYSESRTTWMTPTQVGFFLNPNAGHSSSSNLRTTQTFSSLSWQTNQL